MALDYSKTSVELREVLLKNKPRSMLDLSAKGTVPVLVLKEERDQQTVLDESLDIMLWCLARNDPEDWLRKGDPAGIFELINYNDEKFKPWLDRYKYNDRYPDITREQAKEHCAEFLERLNNMLGRSGFLFQKSCSLADIAIFPFVRQFALSDRNAFDAMNLVHLTDWLDKFLQSSEFLRCMRKFPPWKEGDPVTVF